MDSSTTEKPRRQISLIAGLAIILILGSGLFEGTIPFIITVVGIVVAVVGWAYAALIAARARGMDWIGLLVIGLIVGLALAAFSFTHAIGGTQASVTAAAQLGVMVLVFFAFGFGALGGGHVFERGAGAFFGGWGLLMLVIGGTLIGGAIGTTIGAAAAYVTALGFRLYMLAGLMALVAWITGLVVAFRTGAWGWTTLVVLLPAIGAFMFGLFGPTRRDVLMAQEHARQRRAVGLS